MNFIILPQCQRTWVITQTINAQKTTVWFLLLYFLRVVLNLFFFLIIRIVFFLKKFNGIIRQIQIIYLMDQFATLLVC